MPAATAAAGVASAARSKAFSLASLLGMEGCGIDIGGWSQWGYHNRATPLIGKLWRWFIIQ